MKLTGIREQVFLDRYSLKDEKGKPVEKTPEAMWKRVAAGVAAVEKKADRKYWEKKFSEAMNDFKLVPGGRILSGAGTGYKVTFYNCFVIPSPKDSRDGILDTLKQMVEIMARGGGVGINLSSLRPRGARVRKVNGFSSGPCNWAELFSVATKDIIQQGGTRRGALMLMLWDWHPDIEEFITVKRDLSRINGANLSVCVSDKFMEAVKKDADWDLVFPDIADREYDTKWDGYLDNWLKLGKKVKVHKTVKARKIWDLISEAAWASAEPGLVFMERYNKWNNNWYFNNINCVNPCGEEGLPAWGVCNLTSINLSALVRDGKIDYQELAEIAQVGVRFQDDIIDADSYVFPQIEETQKNGERRIGLGTMGLGDALIKMKIRYGSPLSIRVIDKIYSTIRNAAYEASTEIAKEKGAFPKFEAKKYLKGYFIKQLPEAIKAKIKKWGIRNSVLLQQAPTGSTSLLAGVTSGIEPVYEFSFIRRDRLGEHRLFHPLFDQWKKEHPNDPIPDYFVSANDLIPDDHVKVQAAIQKYVDASISKTVNAPNSHTVEDVRKLYRMAYELGCKGITYMRDGSRPGVLERVTDKKAETSVTAPDSNSIIGNGKHTPEITPRPMVVKGATYQIDTPVGAAFVTINTDMANEPLEIFINVGKAGSDVTAMAEAVGRLASLTLRIQSSVPASERAKQIFNQLIGIGGSKSLGFGDKRVRSLPDAVAKILAMHFDYKIKNGNGLTHKEVIAEQQPLAVLTQQALPVEKSEFDLCPSCGEAALAYEEGCKKCYSCGYSEC
ncbi:ribonucleoside-diphosphate reductase [Candidatus Gottesmanbacteria bacterium RIFCSPHIGHO2_01_FULL_42_27]|uniref:Vitamin B12-dependent ribonucleotide reductase n=2 Tax=Candidatus Gottesmaniibacteriota TaxID=1752720 RepID=A0A1F6BJN4_9BACT|nr:MAG: Ribonucleoside-diphosphate reductase [Candidatus Gottesmanbacteria bacterium GW2011_GWA2_42_18]OGG09101.1 MAG: ribonucleoside-diphosphate reductase [Candidatus Gottesmanbacteria bacterium RIFCSPHIGHO2_01_FULL_42_27]OGG19903.1 MAG: ribonucleoside-diphosphate reductase [Candidatus Gottesmanbacteria bacterium RIFCSPHIGHO2_12_FULL_43_26]OGG37110.1 MAG: ribonucleoside-diphosphate reductase [Candidatus Gottesmanbacteria bacterium RIFCSPLOWO2_01_FULL_42_22]